MTEDMNPKDQQVAYENAVGDQNNNSLTSNNEQTERSLMNAISLGSMPLVIPKAHKNGLSEPSYSLLYCPLLSTTDTNSYATLYLGIYRFPNET